MKCGREPGGHRADEEGTCPAGSDRSFEGINSGISAGRICWAVAGTFCNGKIQGTFAEKRNSCMSCDFYRKVQVEEVTADLQTKFLRFISENDRNPIFEQMNYKHVKAGERFVNQGEIADTAFIIQRGSCLVIVEKNDELHPVDHYGQGDIVGGVGILTGEPRRAHVEAETDMDLWELKRSQFEDISRKDPEILNFLTEIVADRFNSRRPTAYRTIGKYIATDIIGRGGFSIVYKGVHKSLNLPVAIKMMRHDMAMNTDFFANFRNEAKTIASLNHESIVKVYDIEERYRTLFIIMEHVVGDPLSEMIKRLKTIPPHLVVDFLVQICSALDYAHQHGIIHRDINLTNIIVQRNDRLKILDFGLACSVGTEDFGNTGTAYYIAPEQIRGDPVDPRTDIYAVGICAYEMVTGKKPFPEKDLQTLLNMTLTRDIPDPVDRVPELPDELRRFILKATQRNPEGRYRNAGEAMGALSPLLKNPGVAKKNLSFEQIKMSTFFLIFKDEHQPELNRLIEEFGTKAQKLGVEIKIADFKDA
jgi:eukaryotic-like serine/threonine-protein kinase